jgi:hypothetical protein
MMAFNVEEMLSVSSGWYFVLGVMQLSCLVREVTREAGVGLEDVGSSSSRMSFVTASSEEPMPQRPRRDRTAAMVGSSVYVVVYKKSATNNDQQTANRFAE